MAPVWSVGWDVPEDVEADSFVCDAGGTLVPVDDPDCAVPFPDAIGELEEAEVEDEGGAPVTGEGVEMVVVAILVLE